MWYLMKLHLGGLRLSNWFHVLDSCHTHSSLYGDEGEANEDGIDRGVNKNLWKSGAYQKTGEDRKLIRVDSPPSLRITNKDLKEKSEYYECCHCRRR